MIYTEIGPRAAEAARWWRECGAQVDEGDHCVAVLWPDPMPVEKPTGQARDDEQARKSRTSA